MSPALHRARSRVPPPSCMLDKTHHTVFSQKSEKSNAETSVFLSFLFLKDLRKCHAICTPDHQLSPNKHSFLANPLLLYTHCGSGINVNVNIRLDSMRSLGTFLWSFFLKTLCSWSLNPGRWWETRCHSARKLRWVCKCPRMVQNEVFKMLPVRSQPGCL